jgi:hypothetical protein
MGMRNVFSTIIGFCAILNSFCAIGQNFAPLGAKWHYSLACPQQFGCGYHLFEVASDTMIAGKSASVLEYSINGQMIPDGQQILYSDSGKVYYWMNNGFKLMFDFHANTGDTLTLKVGPSLFTGGYTIGYYKVIIDSVNFTEVSGESYRTLHSHLLYNVTFEGYPWGYFGPVIEGIGDSGFLFGHSANLPTIDHLEYLRCYEDDSIYYNPTSIQCDFISGLNEYNAIDKPVIYPNPVSHTLNIPIGNEQIRQETTYQVFDIFGKVIMDGKTCKSSVDVSNLPTGAYLLNINNHQFKFLKQ